MSPGPWCRCKAWQTSARFLVGSVLLLSYKIYNRTNVTASVGPIHFRYRSFHFESNCSFHVLYIVVPSIASGISIVLACIYKSVKTGPFLKSLIALRMKTEQREKPNTWRDLNPLSLDHEAWTLLLCSNRCPMDTEIKLVCQKRIFHLTFTMQLF